MRNNNANAMECSFVNVYTTVIVYTLYTRASLQEIQQLKTGGCVAAVAVPIGPVTTGRYRRTSVRRSFFDDDDPVVHER